MPHPEIKGQQLRIRVLQPSIFVKGTFRTQDVGGKGKLHRIGGILKYNKKWATQSWRLNLTHYRTYEEARRDLSKIDYSITDENFKLANKLLKEWYIKK